MALALDRKRLAKVLALLGSDFPEERDSAARAAEKLRREARVGWFDIVVPNGDAVAREAVEILLAENEGLRAELAEMRTELEELRHRGPDWTPISLPLGKHVRVARWVLDLHAEDQVFLTEFEQSFLATCARWRGPLTPKQGPIFGQIVDRVRARTGLRPPA